MPPPLIICQPWKLVNVDGLVEAMAARRAFAVQLAGDRVLLAGRDRLGPAQPSGVPPTRA